MKKILTYGTFDLFHIGHLNILKRAADLGDHSTVGISTDDFNEKKRKKCVITYEDRKAIVESLRTVDAVLPENSWDQKIKDVVDHDIDIFVIGDDWKGKFDYLNEYCEVVYLSRTPDISTTILKKSIKSKIK